MWSQYYRAPRNFYPLRIKFTVAQNICRTGDSGRKKLRNLGGPSAPARAFSGNVQYTRILPDSVEAAMKRTQSLHKLIVSEFMLL